MKHRSTSHSETCAEWGVGKAEMATEPKAVETVAYTRFVLDRGLAGDLLDLHVALAPCILGYAEIGFALSPFAGVTNPYSRWMNEYAGPEY